MSYNGPNPHIVSSGGTGRATLTAHAVLVGNATTAISLIGPSSTSGQILQSQGASADPAYSTATYPSTTTVSQILYSSATNTVSGLATANRAVLTTGATGIPALTALATDGQLIIGSTSGAPAAATLTAGSGITITNASNSITITATGGGGGSLSTLTGNTGGAISPTAGNINTLGDGSITIAGSGSTLTTQLTGLTAHNVLIGQGTTTIGLVAPSATGGVPLVSNGAGSDPDFSTAMVAGGGTGSVSFTAYSVICGGTTGTNPLQNVSGVGTSGQVLTSNGAGALPTWQTNTGGGSVTTVASRTITSTSTYTPTSGMKYCIVEIVGGGGGGGSPPSSSIAATAAGGGGYGGYTRRVFSAAEVGAGQTVTIGAGGAGGSGGPGTGGTGGTTSFGAYMSATGGAGGVGSTTDPRGGSGGTASGGTLICPGTYGLYGMQVNGGQTFSGAGGSGVFGAGGLPVINNTTGNGGSGYGAGGSGGAGAGTGGGGTGGGGGAGGVCYITEFIS